MSLGSLLPPLGETICCPCCDRTIPALVLTNAYHRDRSTTNVEARPLQ